MQPTRRSFCKAGIAGATGLAGSGAIARAASKAGPSENPRDDSRPNILLIMTDQHSPHFLRCYGNELVRTPTFDRLAGEGMRFTNAYVPAPLCVPSRMSFLTSRTPTHNRVWNNTCILNSGAPTWAHALGMAGYETSLIGRMHFAGPDQRHGFQNRPIGEYGAKHPGVPYKCKVSNRPPYYHGGSGQMRPDAAKGGKGKTTYQYMDEQIAAKASEYLRGHAGSRERPFAAVVGFVLPHCPFIAPKELFDYYYSRVDLPKAGGDVPPTVRRFRTLRKIEEPLTEHQTRVSRAAYYGLVEHIDSLIGNIVKTLDETGLADNTLVVYCTDHGELAGEHGCWWKSIYYEGASGTPLIARLPGKIAAGMVSDAVCSLMDLGPTLADAAGAKTMHDCDGRSLWPTLTGNHPSDWPNETFSELCDHRGGFLPSRMIRSNEWKLWYFADEAKLPPTLFNLENDPDETRDLGQDPKYADVRKRLLEKLRADWDPQYARKATRQKTEDFRTLARWGRKIRPPAPDAMEVPPPSYEKDVEML